MLIPDISKPIFSVLKVLFFREKGLLVVRFVFRRGWEAGCATEKRYHVTHVCSVQRLLPMLNTFS